MSLMADERETCVNAVDSDDVVRVWSAQKKHITKMRNHPEFTEVDSGTYGTSPWASFTVPADLWSPTGVRRPRKLTDEQRAAIRDRLQKGREAT